MTNTQKLAKVKRVIIAVLNSPNQNAQRAALWVRLQKLKAQLQNG
jgi:hypothetical protein